MALRIKPGVDFGTMLTPAGARILEVLKAYAPTVAFDITITSARDGQHGMGRQPNDPPDPHYTGEAFDLRTKTLTDEDKRRFLAFLRDILYQPSARKFYAFLEAPGQPNEHIHVQRRNGETYTIDDYLHNR